MVAFFVSLFIFGALFSLFAAYPMPTLVGVVLTIGAFYIFPGWLVWTLVIIVLSTIAIKGVLL